MSPQKEKEVNDKKKEDKKKVKAAAVEEPKEETQSENGETKTDEVCHAISLIVNIRRSFLIGIIISRRLFLVSCIFLFLEANPSKNMNHSGVSVSHGEWLSRSYFCHLTGRDSRRED